MCYHKSLNVNAAKLEERYDASFPQKADYQPIYHAAGFQFPAWPIVTRQEPGKLQLVRWGLVPRWVKSSSDADEIRARTLNAKAETLFEKPSFRQSISAGRRCLIPVTGFFEWYTQGKKKYPFFIQTKDQPIFSIAGIWDEWADPETGEVTPTYSLLTTEANDLLANIHNTKKRMPVLLTPEAEHAWLHEDLNQQEVLDLTANLYPDKKMHSYSISKRITSRTEPSDAPEVLETFTYPELESKKELFA
ncbi:SOS response-associated peptidase [Tellurirhabdus bombi]|uniref:SOS response-associated peptidase n=1 Tax=Tellurirhabdus bombi TaxID=2907205 RepID=UPI001F44EFB1|nr:SOS response-associated peptidase [Tellurirhabdus bombi]